MNWPFKAKFNLNPANFKFAFFLTFSIFSISFHYSHSFIHSKSPAVFLFIFLCLLTPCCCTFNLTLFSFFLPRSTHSSSVCVCYLHSSSCCHLLWAAVQTKRKRDQRLPLLSKATKIKGWIYKQTLSLTHTHGCTHTEKILSHIYTGTRVQKELW